MIFYQKSACYKLFVVLKTTFSKKFELNCFTSEVKINFSEFFVNLRKLLWKILNFIFTKLVISQKLIETFLLCKNYLTVYTLSFEIRANVIFSHKIC